MGADLVDEDRGCVAEDDMAVVRGRELGVDEFEGPEFTPHLGRLVDVSFSEFAGVAVGDQCQSAKVVVGLACRQRLYTEDLVRVRILDDVCDCCLNDCDVWRSARCLAEFLDEAAMVERASFWATV